MLSATAFTPFAAELTPADREATRLQQQQLLDQNQQQRDELERTTTLPDARSVAPAQADGGPCFTVSTIRLSGSTLVPMSGAI